MKEKNQMGIIDQFILATSKWKNYNVLTKLKTGKIAFYVAILVLLTTFISSGIPLIGSIISVGGYQNLILNQIPQFELSDGVMHMEQRMEIDAGIGYYMVDTDQDTFTKADLKSGYLQEILVSKNNVYGYAGGQYLEMDFSKLPNVTLNNATLAAWTPFIYLIQLLAFGITYLLNLIMYLLGALLFAVVGNFMGTARAVTLDFGKLFCIAIYAKTLAAVVDSVNSTMGYIIPDSLWMMVSTIMTFVFMSMGIMSHGKPPEVKPKVDHFL